MLQPKVLIGLLPCWARQEKKLIKQYRQDHEIFFSKANVSVPFNFSAAVAVWVTAHICGAQAGSHINSYREGGN